MARQTAPAAFGESLALRADRIVADSSQIGFGWLSQTSPARGDVVRCAAAHARADPLGGRGHAGQKLGTFTIYATDLRSSPFPFTIDVRGVPDGYYRYMAEVWDGDARIATRQAPVVLAAGIATQHLAVTGRLATIAAHDSAKATILYPFDLARVINLGKRVDGSGNGSPEFGLSQAGARRADDFGAGLRSRATCSRRWRRAKTRDGARARAVRHYHIADRRSPPVHVFVPSRLGSPRPRCRWCRPTATADQVFDRDHRSIP